MCGPPLTETLLCGAYLYGTRSTYIRYEKFTKNFNAVTRDAFTQWEDNTEQDVLEIRLICPSFGSSCVRL